MSQGRYSKRWSPLQVELVCGYCKEVFYKHPGGLKPSKSGLRFCSMACVGKYRTQSWEQVHAPQPVVQPIEQPQKVPVFTQADLKIPQPVRFSDAPHSRTLNPAPVSTHQKAEGCYRTEPTKTDE